VKKRIKKNLDWSHDPMWTRHGSSIENGLSNTIAKNRQKEKQEERKRDESKINRKKKDRKKKIRKVNYTERKREQI
jgi:hypothetical protein